MKKEIEKIKEALIGYDPEYFKIAVCDHEPEKINYQPDFEGKSTSKYKFDPYFRCKKCGCITDENGKEIIQHRT